VLWRLDGFDIPNPNHFGAMGGTGGPVGMINNNQLTNSDFYTGAFPAEYGNATSGVFDLRLRNGNSERHELMTSAGFSGFELGAEGPISRKTGATYMVNGRYSFLKALDLAGINIAGTGGAIPEYQDLTAKVNLPLKSGNLSLVAMLGASRIHMKPDMSDTVEWFFEITNVTNHKNIMFRIFNTTTGEYNTTNQQGFMPMGGCRVYF
jgi:hypothetical protein